MRRFSLLAVSLFFLYSCNDKTAQSTSRNADSTGNTTSQVEGGQNDWAQDSIVLYGSKYRISSNEVARELAKHFRTAGLSIRRTDPPPHNQDDKKNLRVFWDADILRLALQHADEVMAVTAGYPANYADAGKRNKATILLAVIIKSKSTLVTSDTLFYFPVREELCPLPEPCP